MYRPNMNQNLIKFITHVKPVVIKYFMLPYFNQIHMSCNIKMSYKLLRLTTALHKADAFTFTENLQACNFPNEFIKP